MRQMQKSAIEISIASLRCHCDVVNSAARGMRRPRQHCLRGAREAHHKLPMASVYCRLYQEKCGSAGIEWLSGRGLFIVVISVYKNRYVIIGTTCSTKTCVVFMFPNRSSSTGIAILGCCLDIRNAGLGGQKQATGCLMS